MDNAIFFIIFLFGTQTPNRMHLLILIVFWKTFTSFLGEEIPIPKYDSFVPFFFSNIFISLLSHLIAMVRRELLGKSIK